MHKNTDRPIIFLVAAVFLSLCLSPVLTRAYIDHHRAHPPQKPEPTSFMPRRIIAYTPVLPFTASPEMEVITPTSTPTATPTHTPVLTMTLAATATPTPTDEPPVTPTPLTLELVHDACGDRAHIFVRVYEEHVNVPIFEECWQPVDAGDGNTDFASHNGGSMRYANGTMDFWYEYEKVFDYSADSTIDVLIPYPFEAATYEVRGYCDDTCSVDGWYDDDWEPFWPRSFDLTTWGQSRTLASVRRMDGYFLIHLTDAGGGAYIDFHIVKTLQ